MHWYSDDMKAEAATIHLGLDDYARRVRIHTPEEASPIFEHVEDWMRLLGYSRRDIFSVRLVMQEAVTNALRHGNGNDPTKHVEVTYIVSPEEVLAEVRDQGNGFNPDALPNPLAEENRERPSGRGVFLMRLYSSWICFNQKGNCVTLCRRRTES